MPPLDSQLARATGGALAPLRYRPFALVWLATLLGNIALWMRDVASGWLMTSLDPRPGMVALIQAASYLPVAIFVLPAGVIADVFDRRTVIVAAQLLLCAVGITLGVLTHLGALHPWGLIALCLLGGIVAAFAQPAWQAILPEVLPAAELPRGMALYNLGFNIARVIGPAAAGAIIAASGIVGAYAANVVLFMIGAVVLASWKHVPERPDRSSEPMLSALATGARFVRENADLRRVLIRAPLFFLCFSSYWALLPLLAREQLHGSPSYYGALLGCLGAGAIIGAFVMPRLRGHLSGGKLVRIGSLVSAATTIVLGDDWKSAGRGSSGRCCRDGLDDGGYHIPARCPGTAAKLGARSRHGVLPVRVLWITITGKRDLGTGGSRIEP